MARAMKDSGIEWIGEIPEGWGTIRLKYSCSIMSGYPFDSAKFSNASGYPLIRIRDITSGRIETFFDGDYDPSFIISDEDVLVGMDGDFNVRWWNAGNALLNQRCCKVTAGNGLSSRYLYYCLPLLLGRINQLTYSTTVKHLSVDDIYRASIPLISEHEQSRIAAFLDAECARIDAVIEQTRASIEEYKKLKQSVITQAVTKGIRPGRKMKDSRFLRWGMIPVDWQIARVKSYVDSFTSGLSAITEDENASDSGKYVLRTSSVSSGTFIPTEVKPVLSSAIDRLICPVESGTLIVSRMNTSKMVGACAYVENAVPDTYLPDKLWKIKLKKTVNTKYFWYSLNATPARAWFSELSTGSSDSMQNISMSDFVNNCIPIPLLDEQQAIVAFLDSKCSKIDGLITTKQQFLAELESYKKSLIFEYVTGKKEVV